MGGGEEWNPGRNIKQPKIKDEEKLRNNFHIFFNTGAIFLLDMLVAAQRHWLLQVSAKIDVVECIIV